MCRRLQLVPQGAFFLEEDFWSIMDYLEVRADGHALLSLPQ